MCAWLWVVLHISIMTGQIVCMVVGGVAYLYHDGADCVPGLSVSLEVKGIFDCLTPLFVSPSGLGQ